MLLSKTISTLISSSVSSAEERKKQVRITTPNSFIPGPCLRNKGAVPLFCQQCLRRLPTDNVADGGGDGGGGDNDGDDGDDGGGGNVGDDGDDGGGGNVGDGAAADDKDCLVPGESEPSVSRAVLDAKIRARVEMAEASWDAAGAVLGPRGDCPRCHWLPSFPMVSCISVLKRERKEAAASRRHTPTLDFLIPGYKHCLPEHLLSPPGSCRL